jgi:hypothetical protein
MQEYLIGFKCILSFSPMQEYVIRLNCVASFSRMKELDGKMGDVHITFE